MCIPGFLYATLPTLIVHPVVDGQKPKLISLYSRLQEEKDILDHEKEIHENMYVAVHTLPSWTVLFML